MREVCAPSLAPLSPFPFLPLSFSTPKLSTTLSPPCNASFRVASVLLGACKPRLLPPPPSRLFPFLECHRWYTFSLSLALLRSFKFAPSPPFALFLLAANLATRKARRSADNAQSDRKIARSKINRQHLTKRKLKTFVCVCV